MWREWCVALAGPCLEIFAHNYWLAVALICCQRQAVGFNMCMCAYVVGAFL
jgi:hypothetical protein